MKTNFSVLLYLKKQKNYTSGTAPTYLRITVNGQRAELTANRECEPEHTKYGVKDEHYSAVGSALIWPLEKGLGEHWNDDVRIAWTEIYITLAGAMMTAQKE